MKDALVAKAVTLTLTLTRCTLYGWPSSYASTAVSVYAIQWLMLCIGHIYPAALP